MERWLEVALDGDRYAWGWCSFRTMAWILETLLREAHFGRFIVRWVDLMGLVMGCDLLGASIDRDMRVHSFIPTYARLGMRSRCEAFSPVPKPSQPTNRPSKLANQQAKKHPPSDP